MYDKDLKTMEEAYSGMYNEENLRRERQMINKARRKGKWTSWFYGSGNLAEDMEALQNSSLLNFVNTHEDLSEDLTDIIMDNNDPVDLWKSLSKGISSPEVVYKDNTGIFLKEDEEYAIFIYPNQ